MISLQRTGSPFRWVISRLSHGCIQRWAAFLLCCVFMNGVVQGQDRPTPRPSRVQLEAQTQQFQVVDSTETVRKRVSQVLVGRSDDFETYEVDALPVEYKFEEPVTNSEVMLQPVVHPFKKLRYEEDDQLFAGGIMVFLENSSAPGKVDDLSAPITVVFSGEVETITPEVVTIDQTNTPIFVEIKDDAPTDSILIEVSTAIGGNRYPTYLGVLPELISIGTEKEIQGGGFQVSELEVQVRGVSIKEERTVQFSLENGAGYINPKQVVLSNAQHTARTNIRSAGWETATVLAYVEGIGNARFNVNYVFPLSFFMFTLVGGLLGGLIRGFEKGKKAWQVMLSGLPPAILIVMLYFVLRVNVISDYIPLVDAYNEGTICVVAAMAALFGAKRIHSMFAGKKDKVIPA